MKKHKRLNEKIAVFGAFLINMKAAIPWTLSNNFRKTEKLLKENSRYLHECPDTKYRICRVYKIKESEGRYNTLITRWVDKKRLLRLICKANTKPHKRIFRILQKDLCLKLN